MKYSSNLESLLNQVREFQPALADMLEKYVLSEKDHFMKNFNGSEWVEPLHGQVWTAKDCSFFLWKDRLSLCADANIAAVIANSATEYDYCRKCSVIIKPMADGCRDSFSLSVEISWLRFK